MESILLLEDDLDFCEDVTTVLREQGYQVTATTSASEALAAAEKAPYHLILSDVRMAGPDDGVSVVEQIKQRQPFIRSILMTGYATLDVPLRAARVRADDYLRKPFELDALVSSVQALLENEAPFRGFLTTLRESSGGPEAEHPASWLFNPSLTQLGKVRSLCLSRFYLLIRSNRHSARDLYPYFCLWERLELEHTAAQEEAHWDTLAAKYARLEEVLIELEGLEAASASLTFPLFSQLYEKIQTGRVEVCQLERAIELLHKPELMHRNLESYCCYHWIWSEAECGPDAFEGLSVSRYRLLRRRSSNNRFARLYEAQSALRIGQADLVLCLPAQAATFALIQQELRTGQCRLLQQARGHFLLLYPGQSNTLARLIPPTGCAPAQAWSVLRPVFQQVYQYHLKGRCCGLFGPASVEIESGHLPRLRRFDRQAFALRAAEMQHHPNLLCALAAPEISRQPFPTPLSDQYCLGRILFRTVLGQPAQSFPTHLFLSLGHPAAEQGWKHVAPALGLMAEPIHRMCQAQPEKRFADLREAARHLDGLFPEAARG